MLTIKTLMYHLPILTGQTRIDHKVTFDWNENEQQLLLLHRFNTNLTINSIFIETKKRAIKQNRRSMVVDDIYLAVLDRKPLHSIIPQSTASTSVPKGRRQSLLWRSSTSQWHREIPRHRSPMIRLPRTLSTVSTVSLASIPKCDDSTFIFCGHIRSRHSNDRRMVRTRGCSRNVWSAWVLVVVTNEHDKQHHMLQHESTLSVSLELITESNQSVFSLNFEQKSI